MCSRADNSKDQAVFFKSTTEFTDDYFEILENRKESELPSKREPFLSYYEINDLREKLQEAEDKRLNGSKTYTIDEVNDMLEKLIK